MGLFDAIKQIFKRTKLEEWEVPMLANAIGQMGPQHARLKEQLDAGIVWFVTPVEEPIENYVMLGHEPSVAPKYEDPKGRLFNFTNIGVYTKGGLERAELEIYIGYGLVNGYTLSKKGFVADPANIDISQAKTEFLDVADDEIKAMFTPEESALINWDDVYEVDTNDGIYYRLKDLGNGSFIAFDEEKNLTRSAMNLT